MSPLVVRNMTMKNTKKDIKAIIKTFPANLSFNFVLVSLMIFILGKAT
jgi:hypothetical protein